MDWLLATPQLHSAFSSLGSIEGDHYVVSSNALAILDEINYKLLYEDQTLRTFRRAIGFGQNVRSDLIPLLENTKDDAVLESVIRLLANLTVPVECLFSVDIMYRTEVGRLTIFELNKLLYTCKEAFTEPKSTKSVVDFMKHILESETKLSPQKCDQLNNCLLLLRNILHIPETNANFIMPSAQLGGAHKTSMQNTVLWNLFIQSIDKLLLYLMTCPQRAYWGITMVQVIALIYKDQHVSTLQKLLNMWFEASLSESSEDNESNTSPPKECSGNSSPMLTSDPSSDSSDNGGAGCRNEATEGRRQAVLREETEATLQEVSRKGHVYKCSLLRPPRYDQADTDLASNAYGNCSMHGEECMESSDFDNTPEDLSMNTTTAMSTTSFNHLNTTQPAEHVSVTTNDSQMLHTTTTNDADKFKPPPPLPLKVAHFSDELDADLQERRQKAAALKLSQKSPHSGQFHLTKGKCCPQKRECPSSQSEHSDCGYVTQVDHQESISTSSNDDDAQQGKPQHQKPPCSTKPRIKLRPIISVIDKKELRRKKLVKRSKSSLINMKGLVQHTPTDEDISNVLKEFTVDFLLKGYNFLVVEVHKQLLITVKIPIDTSHFFWLLTYFLKFAAQLELDMEHIDNILTFDVISYLTYEGVSLYEQFQLSARQDGGDLKHYVRRMHLVVTAIREFLQAIVTYSKVTHLSDNDRERLRRLKIQISGTEDLRCLFVLLLRGYNPVLQNKQYLQDLIITNHLLLLMLDSTTELEVQSNIRIIQHISQFATVEVMNYYGILLEDFDNNGEYINDCIFTMMHHIGGDLTQVSTLFQPNILKTFTRIWEAEYQICDDWSDLVEFVIHKFMNRPQANTLNLRSTSLTEMTKEHNLENTVCTWTQEEMDTLYWYYVQSKKHNDLIGKIVQLFCNNGKKHKTRISIIQQLLQQDIITLIEYDDLMKFEDAEYQRTLLTTPTSGSIESGIELQENGFGQRTDDIQMLLDLIIKDNKSQHLLWLQKLLLECCYVKLLMRTTSNNAELQRLKVVMEPVAYHYICKNISIPVVQWNNDQALTMQYQPFVLLMHKLGFQLPADAGSVFARIPYFWSPETMYGLAKKLGPLDKLLIKFDTTELEELTAGQWNRCHTARASLSSIGTMGTDEMLPIIHEVDGNVEKMHAAMETFAVPNAKHTNSIIRFTPDPSPTPQIPNWLQLVMRSKCNPTKAPSDESHDNDVFMTDRNCYGSDKKTYALPPKTQTHKQKAHSLLMMMNVNDLSNHSNYTATSAMKSSQRSDATSSGIYVRSAYSMRNLEHEYSALVDDVYENEIAK